jgi:hypothetical protein
VSRLSQRRSKIVRVRSIEHRLAAAREAAAERRIAELLGVARRISDLRASLRPHAGPSGGQSLQATGEMQLRLERAENDLQQPIRQAEARHEQAWTERMLARSREDGAGRLCEKATAGEERATQLREDANRPFRAARRRPA